MRAALPLLLVLAAGVAVAGVRAWNGAGAGAQREFEQRGEALAQALAGSIEAARTRGLEAEERERLRLGAVARRLRSDLARPLGPAAERLAAAAQEERLGRVFLFDRSGGRMVRVARGALPVFSEPGEEEPAPGEEAEWIRAASTAAPLLSGEHALLEERPAANIWGTTYRLTVGVRTEDGGALLVASDAAEVEALQRGGDLARVLAEACRQPDVWAAAVARGGEVLTEARVGDGDTPATATRRFGASLATEEGPAFAVTVTASTARVDTLVAAERRGIVLWAGLGAAAALAAAFLLWQTQGRAQRERLRAQAQQRDQQRLAEMGVLTGLFVHELSNPLNAVGLQLAQLEREGAAAGPAGILRVKQTLGRARESLEAFLALAAPLEPREGEGYGVPHLQQTLVELGSERDVTLRLEVDPRAAALRAAARVPVLDQALRNLVRNAVQATRAGTEVLVTWAPGERGAVCVRVLDHGPGFPAALCEHGPVLGGTHRPGGHGLGLYLARRIVEGLGGGLALANPEGGGAEAVVTLPAGVPAPTRPT